MTQILRQMAEAQLQLQNVSGSDASSDDSDDEDFTVPLESTGADEVSDKSERDPDWEESPTKSDFDRSPSVEKRYRQDGFLSYLLFPPYLNRSLV